MSDLILMHGDTVEFDPMFGAASVSVDTGELMSSAHGSIAGAAVCVEGDEANVLVGPCDYITPVYDQSGQGLLSIDALESDQIATQTSSEGVAVLLLGSNGFMGTVKFTAKFQILVPAHFIDKSSGAPVYDATPEYRGTGNFDTKNKVVFGT